MQFTPTAVAILRIGGGVLFMQHGLQKLFGLFGGFGGTPGATAPLASLMGVAGVLELAGGLLLILGLFVRPVALILAAEMIVAFVKAHLPQGGMPIENGGELALLYALIFVFLAARGAGPVSVDARQGRAGHVRCLTRGLERPKAKDTRPHLSGMRPSLSGVTTSAALRPSKSPDGLPAPAVD